MLILGGDIFVGSDVFRCRSLTFSWRGVPQALNRGVWKFSFVFLLHVVHLCGMAEVFSLAGALVFVVDFPIAGQW